MLGTNKVVVVVVVADRVINGRQIFCQLSLIESDHLKHIFPSHM